MFLCLQHSLIFLICHFMHIPQHLYLEIWGFCQKISFGFAQCWTELAELWLMFGLCSFASCMIIKREQINLDIYLKKSLCNSLKLYKNSYTKTITWLLFLCNITKFSSLDVPIKSLNILDAKQLCGLSSVHMDRKREKSIRLYTGPLFWHTIAG